MAIANGDYELRVNSQKLKPDFVLEYFLRRSLKIAKLYTGVSVMPNLSIFAELDGLRKVHSAGEVPCNDGGEEGSAQNSRQDGLSQSCTTCHDLRKRWFV